MIEIKLPESIKVGGYDYAVILSAGRSADLKHQNLWGEARHGSFRDISIDVDAPPQEFTNTVIHEITHSICKVYGVDLGESQVTVMANGLHQVFEQLGIRFIR